MKKTYIKPSMFAVTLQLHDSIMQVIVSSANSESAEIGDGGDGTGMVGDVKGSKNIWDEEW